MKSIISTLALLATISAAWGQAAPVRAQLYRFGLFGSYNAEFDLANFRELPGMTNCCTGFRSGSGTGASFGVLFEIPIRRDLFLGLRGDYTMYKDRLSTIESLTAGMNGAPTQVLIDHTLDYSLCSIGLCAELGFPLFDRLYLQAGPRLGIVMNGKYDYLETMISPIDIGGFTPDGKRTRNPVSSSFNTSPRFNAALDATLGYEVPIGEDRCWYLVPEVGFQYGLSDLVDGVDWTVNQIHAGAAVKFTVSGVVYRNLEPPPRPATPQVQVTAAGVDRSGLESPGIVSLRESEQTINEVTPMLNYVFFDYNSAAIPGRYQGYPETAGGPRDPKLAAYYSLLDEVADRLRKSGHAVTVRGYNDGVGEQGNKYLSELRANAVRKALIDRGVLPAQILVEGHGLPPNPSTLNGPDGVAENRRVEIDGVDWELTKPITRQSFKSHGTDQVAVRFRPQATAPAGVADWRLNVTQNGAVLKTFSGAGALPTVIDWQLTDEEIVRVNWTRPLVYVVEMNDRLGRSATSGGELATERRLDHSGYIVDRTSLILFGFDLASVDPINARIVREFILPRIKPSSTVSVTGYTDRIGEAAYNLKLSQQRAESVYAMLGVPGASVHGVGEGVLLYDNDLPEGRFYSRTVNVEVQTRAR